MSTQDVPAPVFFPSDGRRLVVYVVYDRRGDVGGYIRYALEGLREHADHILVVVNGALTPGGRAVLETVSDEILERDNTGFDIEAHRDALIHLGPRVEDYDEIILANDTWYGPVRPFAPVFDRMDARPVHFWGMTEHPEQNPHPFTGTGTMARHLQSFWIAVRREMFSSPMWADYWRDLPPIRSYNDAILLHETRFTEIFTDAGFVADVAFPSADFPSEHPAIFHADLLVERGCPLMKRRPFFHHPTFLVRHAIIGSELLGVLDRFGYPRDLVLTDLARNVAPRTLNADLALLSVADSGTGTENAHRIAVVVRDARVDDVQALAAPLSSLPSGVRVRMLFTEGEDVADGLARVALLREGITVEAGRSGTDGAFDGYEDLLRDGTVDLLVMIDAEALREPDGGAARTELHRQRDSFVWNRDVTDAALTLFGREHTLGVLFPAMPRMGMEDRAIDWPSERARVAAACARAGIRVPVDEFGPLFSAYGLWIARPAALVALLDSPPVGWDAGHTDMLLAYAAGETGHHTRTIVSAAVAATSHTMLEYTMDRLLSHTYGYRLEQIQFLQRAGWHGSVAPLELLRMHTRLNHPDASHPLLPALRFVRRAYRRLLRLPIRGGAQS